MIVVEEELTLKTWIEALTQPEPEQTRTWHHRWRGPGTDIRSAAHLTVLTSSLRTGGDFAGVTIAGSESWAQIKRIDRHWWVEGHAEGEEWPRVFLPDGAQLEDGGGACWSSRLAADIAWAWLGGKLLEGVVRVPAAGQ